jgi:hypothetical protein
MPYFAWIDPGETTFGSEHLRWDEDVFSFTLAQDEGNPASLTLVVRRPRNSSGNPIGLLGPGRKIWAWFALDCGPDLIRFRGRLVGVPTTIFEELVTLEFVARPIDLVTQKNALADSLRVLPYYDEAVIDPTRRTDPEVVLEGYSAIWHYDRETHVLTISDEITGEDGLVEFDGASEDGKVLYDGLGLTLTSGPLTRVDISAEFAWTQLAQGTVELTKALLSQWPGAGPNYIRSFYINKDSWPKTGASLGDGWIAAEATAFAPSYTPITVTGGSTATVKFPDDGWSGPTSMTTTVSQTRTSVNTPPGSFDLPGELPVTKTSASFQDTGGGGTALTSYSYSYSQSTTVQVMQHTTVSLLAGYAAKRQCTEVVTFSLIADVQHVLTDPDDGEALLINDIKSVNLSEPISDGSVPIGDVRRRSYITTDRGNQSLEHLIALGRAHLLQRSRVVEIAIKPKLSRLPEITLRKNAFLVEPRIGEALGKIIGYSVGLNGSDGRVDCQLRIGCAIGRGGSAVADGGDPTYCTVDYTGADYQHFTGRTVLFDTSVGYQPPNADPNDDGLNFLSPLKPDDVIEIPLTVTHAPDGERATFKLKSVTGEFSSDYGLQVTDLKIPTGYNLEAV